MIIINNTQSFFRFYNDDGTQATNTAIAAENTNINPTISSDYSVVLRIKITDAGGVGSAADDWQLQFSKNSGAYTDLTTSSSNAKAFDSSTLAEGDATTERLTVDGTFGAGKVSEDGLVNSVGVSASGTTELVYTITILNADVVNGDTFDFQALYAGTALNYSVTPRITISKAISISRKRAGVAGALIF